MPHGYLVAIETDDSGKSTPENIENGLANGVWFMEGIKHVDIHYLGEIELVDDEKGE